MSMKLSRPIIVVLLIITSLTVTGFLTGFYFHRKTTVSPKPSSIRSDFHYSYFSQKSFFDDGYARAKTNVVEPEAKAIMVNHHLLAPEFIAESFNSVATS